MSLNAAGDIKPKMEKLALEVKKLQKEIKALKSGAVAATNILDKFEKINDIIYYELKFDEDTSSVRGYLDTIKERCKDHLAIALSSYNGVSSIFVQAQGSVLNKNISAVAILKEIQLAAGGRGGGKNTFAQGSIENMEAAEIAIKNIKNNI